MGDTPQQELKKLLSRNFTTSFHKVAQHIEYLQNPDKFRRDYYEALKPTESSVIDEDFSHFIQSLHNKYADFFTAP